MSHFARVRTLMRDREALRQALTELNYRYEEGDLQVRGWGEKERAEESRLAAQGGDWPAHVVLSGDLQMFHAQFLVSVEAKVRLLRAVGSMRAWRGCLKGRSIPRPVNESKEVPFVRCLRIQGPGARI